MAIKKKENASQKNIREWGEDIMSGKFSDNKRLKVGVQKAKDESDDPSESISSFIEQQKTKRKEFHIMPWKQFDKLGKR
jgi:hypothetical protein